MARNKGDFIIHATDKDRITLSIGEPGDGVPTYRIIVKAGRVQIMKIDGPDGGTRMVVYPQASNVIEIE